MFGCLTLATTWQGQRLVAKYYGDDMDTEEKQVGRQIGPHVRSQCAGGLGFADASLPRSSPLRSCCSTRPLGFRRPVTTVSVPLPVASLAALLRTSAPSSTR